MTIDLGEHINNFIKHKLSIGEVFFGFYVYFIPHIITFMGPYFVFITVIYFTSRLANKSEIIAMFNSGMSFKRFLVPYIFTSTLLAIMFWFLINFVIPKTDQNRLAFENKYIAWVPTVTSNNIHRKIDDSTYFYFRLYDRTQTKAYNVSIERFDDKVMTEKILAEYAIYDTLKTEWTFYNLFERKISPNNKEVLKKHKEKKYPEIKMDPSILLKRWTYIQELDRNGLKNVIADLKQQGSDNYKIFEVELYKRTSKCFGIIILTIIGVILSSKKVRGGLGMHLMLGLALGSVYEVIVKFADSFAIKTAFSPLLATWLPNIIFIFVVIFLWKKHQG